MKQTKKYVVLAIFALVIVVSVILFGSVKINYNISDYLDESTETKISLNIMEDEFGTTGNIQVMVEDITVNQATQVYNIIKSVNNVLLVNFSETDVNYYKPNADDGGATGDALFAVILDGDEYAATSAVVLDDIKAGLDELFEGKTNYGGAVVEKLGQRKGDLQEMTPVGNRMRIIYSIPSRCLFGYRSEFMTDTHGEGVINTLFDGYEPFRGEIVRRFTGSLVASEEGETTRYGLFNTQERGRLFVGPQTMVYEGMVVGENPKNDDIPVNPCKKKQLTAIRSAGADEKLLLTPPVTFTIEEGIEFLGDDELLEVTPKNLRIRKKILNTELRMKEMMRIRRALQENK